MRFVRLLALVLLVVGLLATPAAAQFGPFGPGGIIASSQSFGQVQVTTPSGSAQTLLSQNIAAGALSSPFSFHGRGYISGQPTSPGSITVTVKLGTGSSQTVVSAQTIEVGTGSGKNAFRLDVDWTQQNTGTTAIGLGNASTILTQQATLCWDVAAVTAAKCFPPGGTAAQPNPILTTLSLTTNPTLLIQVTFTNTAFGTGIVMDDWRIVYGG